MMNYFLRRLKDDKVVEIPRFRKGCWINVIEPSAKDIDLLVSQYALDRGLLREGLDDDELPRVDFEDDTTYVYVKVINKELNLNTFLIVLANNFILTLCKNKTTLTEMLLSPKIDFYTTQQKKALIKILSLNNDILDEAIISITKKVNIKKTTKRKLSEKDLDSLLHYEELLNSLATVYTYSVHLYNKLIKHMEFYEADKELLEDLIVESEEGLNVCVSSLKTISNIRNYYTLILSNKLNKTLTVLTIFTIVLSIATTISGFYGMNIVLPLQKNPSAVYIISAIMGILIILFLFYLKRKEIV